MNVIWTTDGRYTASTTQSILAIAVASDGGLVTPVVRNVLHRSNRSPCHVGRYPRTLAERARAGELKQHEPVGRHDDDPATWGCTAPRSFAAIIKPAAVGDSCRGRCQEASPSSSTTKLAIAIGSCSSPLSGRSPDPSTGAVAAEWMKTLPRHRRESMRNPALDPF